MTRIPRSLLITLLAIINSLEAFNQIPYHLIRSTQTETPTKLYGGSWGKRKKEYTEAEFAKEGGDRRGFDAYELQQRSDFYNKIKSDRTKLIQKQDDDFLAIAAMAGITDQNNDGVVPMGDFDVEEDDIDSSIGDEDIDLKVYFNEKEDDTVSRQRQPIDFDPDNSITRLDGPSDVAGIGGEW